MIDIHTHIMPQIDDGSYNIEESRMLAFTLKEFGFDKLAVTPHFYPHRETVENFLVRRDSAMQTFSKSFPEEEYPIGCECYLHPNLFHSDDISRLCYSGTNVLLIELSYDMQDGNEMLALVRRLRDTYNVTPILAHIERYPYITKDEKVMREFLDLGCYAQINLKTLTAFFERKRLVDYVEKGYVRYLGTDSHHTPFDADAASKAMNYLKKRLGDNWQSFFADELPR